MCASAPIIPLGQACRPTLLQNNAMHGHEEPSKPFGPAVQTSSQGTWLQ
ncbi:hypothetical protein OOU_Y34scaffold00711g35 [Pyricularia oryzae Y34]|nr:hypothetical protein OOU_Y34scaffold00711g35 [Pyricularia oryzae Y34]